MRYDDSKIELVESDKAHKLGFPVAVIASARRKLRFIRQAVDERDLRAMKSLHYENLKGERKGQCSIRLNNQWRMIFRVNSESEPREVVILDIEDYH